MSDDTNTEASSSIPQDLKDQVQREIQSIFSEELNVALSELRFKIQEELKRANAVTNPRVNPYAADWPRYPGQQNSQTSPAYTSFVPPPSPFPIYPQPPFSPFGSGISGPNGEYPYPSGSDRGNSIQFDKNKIQINGFATHGINTPIPNMIKMVKQDSENFVIQYGQVEIKFPFKALPADRVYLNHDYQHIPFSSLTIAKIDDVFYVLPRTF